MPTKGLFIVLEGADGSGKGTQFRLLSERLSAVGYEVVTFDFPRYREPSSHFVRQYLNGKYGTAGQINPYAASLFYALDRYEAAPDIKSALQEGKIVLSNRFAGSNMAHQGSKFGTEAQKRGFFMWADSLEFQLLGIPRPDLNIYLRVPAEISYELIERKSARSYTNLVRDEHESDILHLKEAVATYDLLCRLFPRDYQAIESTEKGRLLSIPAINELAWRAIQPYLHDRLKRIRPSAKTVNLSEDTPQQAETNVSRLAVTSAHPPKNLSYKIEELSYLSAISLNTYPDADVAISSSQFVKSAYSYFRAPGTQPGLWADFKAQIGALEEKRVSLLKKLKKSPPKDPANFKWLAEATLPLGALLKINLLVNQANQKPLAVKLAQTKSWELKLLATQLNPTAVALSGVKKRSVSWQSYLPDQFDTYESQLKVLSFWPKRELELMEALVYSQADRASSELGMSFESAPYPQKAELLKQLLQEVDAIEGLPFQPNYRVETLLSSVAASYLAANGFAQILSAQAADPRYGYEVPGVLEKYSLDNDYLDVFDDSLKLYADMQSSKQPDLAIFAALGGHRSRYLLDFTASQIFNLANHPHPKMADEVVRLAEELLTNSTDTHPVFWQIWTKSAKNSSAKDNELSLSKFGPKKTRRRRSD